MHFEQVFSEENVLFLGQLMTPKYFIEDHKKINSFSTTTNFWLHFWVIL